MPETVGLTEKANEDLEAIRNRYPFPPAYSVLVEEGIALLRKKLEKEARV